MFRRLRRLIEENEDYVLATVLLLVSFAPLYTALCAIPQTTVWANYVGNTTYSLMLTVRGTIYNVTVLAGSIPINCTVIPKLPISTSTGVVLTLKCPAVGSEAVVRTSAGTYSVQLPQDMCYTFTNTVGVYNC
jgi:hypothetical protein